MLKHATIFLASLLGASCSGEGRPDYAEDAVDFPGGDGKGSAEPDVDPAGGEALIEGTEAESASACGAVDVEHEVLRPNFYFVLDVSDSMQQVMPNSGGITRHLAARSAILDMLRVVGYRVNFGAAVFPDPDKADGCTPGRAVFDLRPGEPLLEDGSDNSQLDALAFTLRKYSPKGATPVAGTLAELGPSWLQNETPTFVFLLTDGAPNCDLQHSCSTDQCIPNIEGAEFENGPSCDDSYNCCTELFPHLCLDTDDTAQQLSNLAEAGIGTFVIGIPGSEIYAEQLDQLALATGNVNEGGDTDYYSVTDAEELALTLTKLGQELSASCAFDLGTSPNDPELLRVLLDDQTLAENDEDGWEWSGEQSLTLLGEACSAWLSGDVFRVRVLETCTGEAR